MKKRHGTHVILEAITPSRDAIDADKLSYPNLREALKDAGIPSFLKQTGKVLIDSEGESRTEFIAQEFNVAYLLNASYRLQKSLTPPEKLFWSTQFTQASVRMFGRPLNKEIRALAAAELVTFERIAAQNSSFRDFMEPLMKTYRKLARGASASASLEQRFKDTLKSVREIFYRDFQDALSVFDEYQKDLTPQDIQVAFSKAINVLGEIDEAWKKWSVVLDESANLSVNVFRKTIRVGKNRVDVSASDIRGLFAHEVLVHAQRSLNGAQHSRQLRVGLPNYLEAEEGFGVLVESAINGGVPPKVKDRYIDIALALGDYRRRALPREELYTICYIRSVVRGIMEGKEVDLAVLEDTTWEHINRIYRGSLGNKYVGVFTKDVAYYKGFVKMARYFDKARKRDSLEYIVLYTLAGKFDPTNSEHRRIVSKNHRV